MNKNLNFALRLAGLLLLGGLGPAALAKSKASSHTPSRVYPDVTNEIILSNVDTNWVRCKGRTIKDVIFQKEKNIDVIIRGESAYITFLQSQVNGKRTLVWRRGEFIIDCDGAMYKILAKPKAVPSKTVLLTRGGLDRIEANRRKNRYLSEDERILRMIKKVYQDQIPQSWSTVLKKEEIRLFEHLRIELKRSISQDGEGYRLLEFVVNNKGPTLRLREMDFRKIEISKNPVAISIDPMTLEKGQSARLLVVEKVNEQRGLSLTRKPRP